MTMRYIGQGRKFDLLWHHLQQPSGSFQSEDLIGSLFSALSLEIYLPTLDEPEADCDNQHYPEYSDSIVHVARRRIRRSWEEE